MARSLTFLVLLPLVARLAAAEVLASDRITTAGGEVVRTLERHPDARYPLRLATSDAAGAIEESVADHLVVQTIADIDHAAAASLAASHECTVRRRLAADCLLLAFPVATPAVRDAVASRLAADHRILSVGPDRLVRLERKANDPRFPEQWALANAGGFAAVAGADIAALAAWETTVGNRSLLIGVIDSGLDREHPDLAANCWVNPGESGPAPNGVERSTNGIDDDGNGYVDDWRGWDFVDDDNDPADEHGHGTHLAGTIGAVGNNGIGISGVCWQTSLVGLRFLDRNGTGFTSDAVRAVHYARSLGCRLTNNSWGGSGPDPALEAAIRAAGEDGGLFIAAAGNDGTNLDRQPNWPAAYDLDCIISVAASDPADQRAYFSNYGHQHVDLAAPGVSILSTLASGTYGSVSGTSMAAPHVTGVAALLWSLGPDLAATEIKAALLAGVDPLPWGELLASGGRLDAAAALAEAERRLHLDLSGIVQVADRPGDGDGLIEPGEGFALTLTVHNHSQTTATGVAVRASSADPHLVVPPASAFLGALAAGAATSVTYDLAVDAAAATPAMMTLEIAAKDDAGHRSRRLVTVPVHRSSRLAGTVVDATGQALAGATVRARTFTGAWQTASANDGSFAFDPAPDGQLLVAAEAPGRKASAIHQLVLPPAIDDLILALQRPRLVVTTPPPPHQGVLGAPAHTVLELANPGDSPVSWRLNAPGAVFADGPWGRSGLRHDGDDGHAWRFGHPAGSGREGRGQLVFSALSVPVDNPVFAFSEWLHRPYDTATVVLVTAGDGRETVVHRSDSTSAWHRRVIDLGPWAGTTIDLRFSWSGVGEMGDTGEVWEGWYLDRPTLGGTPLWDLPGTTAAPPLGVIAAGGSATVAMTQDTTGLAPGTFARFLPLIADDPVTGGTTTPWQLDLVVAHADPPSLALVLPTGATTPARIRVGLPPAGVGASLRALAFAGTGHQLERQLDVPWNDIRNHGVEIVGLRGADDLVSTPIPLPLPIAYAGRPQTRVTVHTNGVVEFGPPLVEGFSWPRNEPLPSTWFGSAIAPLWDDLALFLPTSAIHHHAPGDGRFVLQFSDLVRYGDPERRPLTFQVAIDADGTISCHYRGTVASDSATIGLQESPFGPALTAAVDHPGFLATDERLVFRPTEPWLEAPPGDLTVSDDGLLDLAVTIDARGLPPGAYHGTLVLTLDGGTILDVPVDLTVVADVEATPSALAATLPHDSRTNLALHLVDHSHSSRQLGLYARWDIQAYDATRRSHGTPEPAGWLDLSAAATLATLVGADDALSPPIPLPFAFPFHRGRHRQVRVSSNGFLTFSGTDAFAARPLPDPAAPADLLAVWWDDLVVPATGTVRHAVIDGTAVFAFEGLVPWSGSGVLEAQVVLHPDGRIDLLYAAVPTATAAVVGSQDHEGRDGLLLPTPSAGTSLHLAPARSWLAVTPDPTPGSFTIGLDSSDLAAGRWQAELEVVGAGEPLVVPVVLEVLGGRRLRLVVDPSQIAPGTQVDVGLLGGPLGHHHGEGEFPGLAHDRAHTLVFVEVHTD